MIPDTHTTTDSVTRIHDLCRALVGVEERIAKLEAQRQTIRAELSYLIDAHGPQLVAGFGKLEMTSPALVVSYDRMRLEALSNALRATGHTAIAESLDDARKESHRAGSLRITREKSA